MWSITEEHCHTVLTGPDGGCQVGAQGTHPFRLSPSVTTSLLEDTGQFSTLFRFASHLVSYTIGTESAPVGGGVCHPGCPPYFGRKRGTASGAFGPLGGILGQKAPKRNSFGPNCQWGKDTPRGPPPEPAINVNTLL